MRRIVALLLTATALSTGILMSTLARYTSAYSAEDMALVAKWAFDVNVDNGSFTEFNIFDGVIMNPMIESGEYTFKINGNSSDTAIDFDVKINIDDLSKSIGIDGEYFPGLLYITVTQPDDNSITYTAQSAYSGVSFIDNWFYIDDCKKTDGTYEFNPTILTGHIPTGNAKSLAVTVRWQWNTSYFIPNEIIEDSSKDSMGDNGFNNTTSYIDGKAVYYTSAETVYRNLVNAKNDSQDDLKDWEIIHEKWFLDGSDTESTDEEGNTTTTHFPCSTSCDISESAHNNAYSSLTSNLREAKQAVAGSLKLIYDKYDTNIINGLDENSINVVFSVSGEQKEPEI